MYQAKCEPCDYLIGNFTEEEDARNALTMHGAILHRKSTNQPEEREDGGGSVGA